MTREDIIVMCEDSISQLEYEKIEEGLVWNTLLEVRAYLVNQGE
jgi:hypothetical protein